MTKVINLFGGPGTGKSTTAAELFALLKHNQQEVELVREFAKDVVWEGRTHLLENQLFLLAEQAKRQADLRDKVDIIVTDSPLLLTWVYCDDPILHSLARREFDLYENANVFLTRVKPYKEAGRVQTEDEAKDLDKKIRSALIRNGVPYIELAANEDAAGEIAAMMWRGAL